MLSMQVIGNLTRDAEVREVGPMRSVVSFSVAHTEKYRDQQGEQQERTVYIDCSYFRKDGNTGIQRYLNKGTKVYLAGRPSVRMYAKKDGGTGASLEMVVQELELL